MRAYIIRRLLLVIPTLLLVTLVVFFLIRLIPGSIIDLMIYRMEGVGGSIGGGATVAEARASVARTLGLDMPIHVQYGRWVGVVRDADGSFSGLLQGNLGDSLWKGTPVIDEIVANLPVTIELTLLATLITIIISIPIGIYSAIRQDSPGDYVGRSFATILIALPGFWVGLMIILVASLWFGLSPEIRPTPFIQDPIGNLGQFIAPAFVLGMAGAGVNMRMTRSMMLEVLRQDYIRTAWAKGLKEGVVIMRHTLKNALIPVITTLGLLLGPIMGGAVVIENVFNLPGIGFLLVSATFARDYTIVSGVILFFAGFMVLLNLGVDLTYSFLDPRVRYK